MHESDYVVVYEKTATSYSAYVPVLPGCVTTGSTLSDTKRNMPKAIRGHLAVMREFGDPIPQPTAEVERIRISA